MTGKGPLTTTLGEGCAFPAMRQTPPLTLRHFELFKLYDKALKIWVHV